MLYQSLDENKKATHQRGFLNEFIERLDCDL